MLAWRHGVAGRACNAGLRLELADEPRGRRGLGRGDSRGGGGAGVTLAEAAARADGLAESGSAQELATLRSEWDDELEAAARSPDIRARALPLRARGLV